MRAFKWCKFIKEWVYFSKFFLNNLAILLAIELFATFVDEVALSSVF